MPDGCQRPTPASSSTRRRRPATSGERGWLAGASRARLEGPGRDRSSARYSATRAGRRGHSSAWTRSASSISASPQARWRKPIGVLPAAGSRCGRQTLEVRERRRIDEHHVLEAGGHRGHPGQGRPVGQGHARARFAQPGHRGASGVVGKPPGGDRDPSATEPGRCRGTLDQLAAAKGIRAQGQHRVAAGRQGGHRRHRRAAPPIHHPALIRCSAVDDLRRRPIAERGLALGVEPAPPLLGGRIRGLLRLVPQTLPDRARPARPGARPPRSTRSAPASARRPRGRRARPPSARR